MADRQEDFANHLRETAGRVLERFPEDLKPEIYALSFRIWRVDYDYRHPYVAIGYNTETQYELERRPEDPGEARWNYACWLLDGFETLGNVPEDPVGGPLYETEVKRLGLWFEGEDGEDGAEGEDEDDEDDAKDDLLQLHFADACIALARHLHASGRIEKIFGRPLPIVIFDMDCPGWEVEATEAANPPELIEGFLTWQRADDPSPS
ncbi:hypothetical protein STRCI_004767 [Streptomyces cinnabarinus]|uniref:DUF4303 domain-containing protein n=1 Tax=Streptomyces cinnabarinus TaxID=67287 RepID=A0ABY7KL54_9ACTN|nr:hypothetical protein [Streptomyces cinnabarinus]WAZ23426.1 hypothetical protein STRCI_004767 [Streptomyces cinnabarinus]